MKYYNKEWYINGCKKINIPKDELSYSKLPEWFKDFSIHDCQIISETPEERGVEFILSFDNSGGFCEYTKLIFSDYIIKENCNIKDLFCIADELYVKSNGRYEYHLLLQGFNKKGKPNLYYFTINCKNITVE